MLVFKSEYEAQEFLDSYDVVWRVVGDVANALGFEKNRIHTLINNIGCLVHENIQIFEEFKGFSRKNLTPKIAEDILQKIQLCGGILLSDKNQ